MNNSNTFQPTRPEYKLSYTFLFWTKPATSFRKELKIYDEWIDKNFKTKSSKILENQEAMINGLSWLCIAILTTTWSALPPLLENMPNWLEWTKLGMKNFGSENWGNQVMITVIPFCSGSLLHFSPKVIPQKKGKLIMNLIIKFIPVIILLISWYLPHTYKLYKVALKIESENYEEQVLKLKKQKIESKQQKLLKKLENLTEQNST